MNSNRSRSIEISTIRGDKKRSFRYNNKKFNNLKKNHSTVSEAQRN